LLPGLRRRTSVRGETRAFVQDDDGEAVGVTPLGNRDLAVERTHLLGAELDVFDLDAHLRDAQEHPLTEVHRGLLRAGPGNEGFYGLLEAVLAKTGSAFLEMDADVLAVVVLALAIQVEVDGLEDLTTGGLVRLTTAHDSALTSPRSTA
jgi:hypothetical protein